MDAGPHEAIKAACLRAVGRTADARRIVDSVAQLLDSGTLRDTVWNEVIRLEDLATYYASAGDAARASLWLERAFQSAPNGVEENVLESPLSDPVRGDSGFRVSLERSQRWIRQRVQEARAAAGRRFGAPAARSVASNQPR